jgi:uncharacterized protein
VRIILDTNVFVSGVFFSGPPYQILKAWRDDKVQLLISPEIFDEYRKVAQALGEQFPAIDLRPILELVTVRAEMFPAPGLPKPVCDDPDDDKFLACAIVSKCKVIVSGDKHLLNVSGFRGISVQRPREFVDRYLAEAEEGQKWS